MPNPASVYCEQNGNTLEIHTAADGSQNGSQIQVNRIKVEG
jgi:putative hemolysin